MRIRIGVINRNLGLILKGIIILFAVSSCAVTRPDIPETEIASGPRESVEFPEYDGPKIPLAVLPMGLSKRAVERYPHLLEKDVGLGVHNILSDALYRTGRFRFVEDKENIIKQTFNWQKMSMAGMVDEAEAVEMGRILGARLVAYGEVFDYSEGKTDRISGLSKSTTPMVRAGVQIRLVDVETLEYIPASSIKYGRDWGDAAMAAIESAVFKIVSGMPE